MNQSELSPEESLKLISEVITDARNQFKEDGFIYILWGTILAISGIGQYLLLYFEYYSINYVPYFLIPVGGIISYFYYKRKASGNRNTISRLIGRLWAMVLLNLIILGFFFPIILNEHLVPVILLILAVAYFISGVALKERLILAAALCINVLGFTTFFIPYEYHALITAFNGIAFTLVPGIILSKKNRD